jgi:hypothetical protein
MDGPSNAQEYLRQALLTGELKPEAVARDPYDFDSEDFEETEV